MADVPVEPAPPAVAKPSVEAKTFVGHDGKTYLAETPTDGSYQVRHDGRFWHILLPMVGESAWQQTYHGKVLPQAADIDRWIKYRPYPPRLR